MASELFCDGGVIGKNPSKIGGTWAWCLVEDGELARFESGIFPARTGDPLAEEIVTNNFTELYAACKALRSVQAGWKGKLYTDSRVTQVRLMESVAFNGIPDWLVSEAKFLRWTRKPTVVLVSGHPSKAELIAGCKKDGKPCSPWNVLCDKRCRKLAEKALRQISRRC